MNSNALYSVLKNALCVTSYTWQRGWIHTYTYEGRLKSLTYILDLFCTLLTFVWASPAQKLREKSELVFPGFRCDRVLPQLKFSAIIVYSGCMYVFT